MNELLFQALLSASGTVFIAFVWYRIGFSKGYSRGALYGAKALSNLITNALEIKNDDQKQG